MPGESVQGTEVASPAFPHFRKSSGRNHLPGSQDSYECPEETITKHTTNLFKY